MAIRDLWAFDHLPQVTGSITGPTSVPLIYLRPDFATFSQGQTNSLQTIAAGWIKCLSVDITAGASSFTHYQAAAGILYTTMSDPSVGKSYIGFRFLASNLTYITSACWIRNITTAAVTNLVPSSLLTVNQEQYIEILIDKVNKEYTVWIDGVLIQTKPLDFAATYSTNSTFFFGPVASVAAVTDAINTSSFWQFKNVYFVDDTQDDTPCTRLGPIKPIQVNLAAGVTAPNWTSSDGLGATADLNTSMGTGGAALTGPLLTNTTLDPVTATLTSALDPAAGVIAMKLYLSGSRQAGNTLSMTSELSLNGSSVAGNALSFPSTAMQWNQSIGLFTEAPDGSILSPANIDEIQLVLTPSV